jgi:hypothetical protein
MGCMVLHRWAVAAGICCGGTDSPASEQQPLMIAGSQAPGGAADRWAGQQLVVSCVFPVAWIFVLVFRMRK